MSGEAKPIGPIDDVTNIVSPREVIEKPIVFIAGTRLNLALRQAVGRMLGSGTGA